MNNNLAHSSDVFRAAIASHKRTIESNKTGIKYAQEQITRLEGILLERSLKEGIETMNTFKRTKYHIVLFREPVPIRSYAEYYSIDQAEDDCRFRNLTASAFATYKVIKVVDTLNGVLVDHDV